MPPCLEVLDYKKKETEIVIVKLVAKPYLEAGSDDGVAAAGHEALDVPEEKVVVLLQERAHVVRHLTRVVYQAEFLHTEKLLIVEPLM